MLEHPQIFCIEFILHFRSCGTTQRCIVLKFPCNRLTRKLQEAWARPFFLRIYCNDTSRIIFWLQINAAMPILMVEILTPSPTATAMMSLVEGIRPDDEVSEEEDDEVSEEEDDEDEDEEDRESSPFLSPAIRVAKIAAQLPAAAPPIPPSEAKVRKPLLPSKAEGEEVCIAVDPASATGCTKRRRGSHQLNSAPTRSIWYLGYATIMKPKT